jgi:hypothetical protein
MRLVYVISFLLCLTACSSKSTNQDQVTAAVKSCNSSSASKQALDLKRYIISLRPALENETDQQVIERTIRDLVYVEFSFGDNEKTSLMRGYDSFKMMIEDKTASFKCWGTVALYRQALQSFLIETRNVSMARDISPGYTHASMEAKINGKWVVSDPTFNIEIAKDGLRIGYSESADGFDIIRGIQGVDGRDIGDNHELFTDAEYAAYFNYIIIHPGPGQGANDVFIYPANFDGLVQLDSGEWVSMLMSPKHFARYLNEAYTNYQCEMGL